jgi:hypothetical protein
MKLRTNIIYLKFWDHAQWSGRKAEPIMCELVGVLAGEDEVCYKIAPWVSDRRIDDNAEQYAVIKAAIIEMRTLYLGPVLKPKRRKK